MPLAQSPIFLLPAVIDNRTSQPEVRRKVRILFPYGLAGIHRMSQFSDVERLSQDRFEIIVSVPGQLEGCDVRDWCFSKRSAADDENIVCECVPVNVGLGEKKQIVQRGITYTLAIKRNGPAAGWRAICEVTRGVAPNTSAIVTEKTLVSLSQGIVNHLREISCAARMVRCSGVSDSKWARCPQDPPSEMRSGPTMSSETLKTSAWVRKDITQPPARPAG
ncbi:uncharacterized protein LAESUDRAFT_716946 [Laetiporus sulphureus 93-53]|uniref:Uncharacterized protein n=1 Tax=Laetiporus sulphureus 93-53 TaxID=1314785 RepID=A0A165C7W1_9APHY|nr:uncharacterized protein LAESUDRAFT_716946 [Laetiporus sulphureus 93-53]KZT02353.1 hypothetical protein LAESUDRAFT_716946 [Laetiporus sulphureus 93-53]